MIKLFYFDSFIQFLISWYILIESEEKALEIIQEKENGEKVFFSGPINTIIKATTTILIIT